MRGLRAALALRGALEGTHANGVTASPTYADVKRWQHELETCSEDGCERMATHLRMIPSQVLTSASEYEEAKRRGRPVRGIPFGGGTRHVCEEHAK